MTSSLDDLLSASRRKTEAALHARPLGGSTIKSRASLPRPSSRLARPLDEREALAKESYDGPDYITSYAAQGLALFAPRKPLMTKKAAKELVGDSPVSGYISDLLGLRS